MESFHGSEKVDYEFVGHSGDGPSIDLVPFGEEGKPKTRAERLRVLQQIIAHTQVGLCSCSLLRASIRKTEPFTSIFLY